MGTKANIWETKGKQRADEVSRALARVGVMTHGQITRLLGVNPKTERDLITHHWDRFEVQHKVPKGVAGGRYRVPGNRVMKLVRLSDDALREWAEREGIARVRNRVPPEVLAQTIITGELLIDLRRGALAYTDWDIMLPQESSDGLHAWMVRRGDPGFRMGVFILPMKLSQVDEGKKGHVFQGIIHRVVQNSNVKNTLFLVTRKYYATALRSMAHLERSGNFFYLLPLESFKEHPAWYLDSIVTDERKQRVALGEHLDWEEKHVVPAGYEFTGLLRFGPDQYRFVDTYINGSIDRVRNWLRYTIGYQVPNTGHVAGADVYVCDETMREALQSVLRTKKRGERESSVAEAQPWPPGMITPETAPQEVERGAKGEAEGESALVDVKDIPDDANWLKYFE